MAMPSLTDLNFYRSVTCVCEHTSSGAIGVVVNQIQPDFFGKDIFDELKMEYIPDTESIPIYLGGPVHMGEVFVLHGPPFEWDGCLKITSSLAMSNTKDIVKAIAMGRGPALFIIALGCAGWGRGQLESELRANAWLTCPLSESIIFDIPVENRWEKALNIIGIDPLLLSKTAGNA